MSLVISSIISFVSAIGATLLANSLITLAATEIGPFLLKWSLKKCFPNHFDQMIYIYKLSSGQSKGAALKKLILGDPNVFESAFKQLNGKTSLDPFSNLLLGTYVTGCLLMVTVSGAKITYKIISKSAFKLINSLVQRDNILSLKNDKKVKELVENVDVDNNNNNNNNNKGQDESSRESINEFSEKLSSNQLFQEKSILTSKSLNNRSITSFSNFSSTNTGFQGQETYDQLKSFVLMDPTTIERKTIPVTDFMKDQTTTEVFDPFLKQYYHNDYKDEEEKTRLNQTIVILTPEDEDNFTETMTNNIDETTILNDNNWEELTQDIILEVDEDQLFEIDTTN